MSSRQALPPAGPCCYLDNRQRVKAACTIFTLGEKFNHTEISYLIHTLLEVDIRSVP